MKYKIFIGTLLFVLLAGAGLSCVQSNSSSARAEISVIDKVLNTDASGNTVLKITVKNTGRVKADFTEVAVKFYDAKKELIDSGRDSVMILNPDETWEFTIPCNSERPVASYEIETTAGTSGGGL